MGLGEEFESLAPIEGNDDVYSARELAQFPGVRIGRCSHGHPSLLFSCSLAASPESVPISLRNLSYAPRRNVEIIDSSESHRQAEVAILTCATNDPLLHSYFLAVLEPLLAELGAEPDESEVFNLITHVVELFRALDDPPRTSLQGLWCELLLIQRSARIRQAAMAWHAEPDRLFDFTAGTQSIEVKSCIGPTRIHHFSLDQVLRGRNSEVIVASFVLEDDGRGSSIGDLWASIVDGGLLTASLRQRLDHILTVALGRDWRLIERAKFDEESAWKSLRLFELSAIPSVDADIPAEVSQVRFASELTDTPHLTTAQVVAFGGLFGAVLERAG